MKKFKKFLIDAGVFLLNTVCKVLMFAVVVCVFAIFALPFGLMAAVEGIKCLKFKRSKENKELKFKEELEKARRMEVATLEHAEFDYIKRHSANVVTKEKTMIDVAEELVENINLDDFEV